MKYLLAVVVANVFVTDFDKLKTARRAEKKCAAGNAEACRSWASLYGAGVVPPEDEPRALAAFLKACNARRGAACAAAAAIVELGQKRDEKRAGELYDRACAYGDADGCFQLGTRRSGATGFQAHRRGCQLGDDGCCELAGLLLLQGEGVPADPAAGMKLLQRACDHGRDTACEIIRTEAR
jgi:uncharacterized protein